MKWKDLHKGMMKELDAIMREPIPSYGIEQHKPEEGGFNNEITQTNNTSERPPRKK